MGLAEENFEEGQFPGGGGGSEEEQFEEAYDCLVQRCSKTNWRLASISADSALVAQRIGNDQSLKFNSFEYGALVFAGNANNRAIRAAFPADWEQAPNEFNDSWTARRGSLTLYDFAYISLPVIATGKSGAVGDFVGLFTGDIVLECSSFGDWEVLAEISGLDSGEE